MIATTVALLGGVRATAFAILALALGIALGAQSYTLSTTRRALATEQRLGAEKDAALAKADADAQLAAREAELALAAAYAVVDGSYQRGLDDAKAMADRLVADLRSEHLRLRAQWRCPAASGVPAAAAGPGGADEGSDDRAASAARIVRAAAECDAQVTALQAIVAADRSVVP